MSRFVPVMCAVAALSFVAGCGSDETAVAPVASGGGTGVDSGVDAEAGTTKLPPPAEAGTRVRTVEQRNPFGDTSIEANLLVDGDFELSGASGQYGWIAFASSAQAKLQQETGGLCRSGVTCGVLAPDTTLVAYGAAARDKTLQVSLWAKPPEPDCGLVSVSLLSCDNQFHHFAPVTPVSDTPDSSGWCNYQGVTPPLQEEPCLFVDSAAPSGENALVDDASLVAADGSGSRPLAAFVPSPAQYRRVTEVLDWLHRHRRY